MTIAITSRTIPVDHIRVVSEKPYKDVKLALEDTVPRLDRAIVEILNTGDQAGARAFEENGPKLSIFLVHDHGALLQIAGGARNAIQYEIGNPLTASKMTRHKLPAGLYAPLRVILYEDEQGRGVFEYDRPSSFFGQFGDGDVTVVGLSLDQELDAALRKAAG